MSLPHFIPVGEVLVDRSLIEVPFACDVQRCRGACCTVPGEEGAPLLEEELPRLEAVVPRVLPRLSLEAQQVIRAHGAVMEREGRYYTRCVGEGPCVFVVWEGELARCALQQAYERGESDFPKPLSCQLFPVRLRERGGQLVAVFEPFRECAPAYVRGRCQGMTVAQMVRAGLERAFGVQWYEELQRAALGQSVP
jgi:hypothetical protein